MQVPAVGGRSDSVVLINLALHVGSKEKEQPVCIRHLAWNDSGERLAASYSTSRCALMRRVLT